MKTAGIIAEYNPFHNGHHFHIEETRRQTGADYIIVVMSGDFTQRGTPALTDKYARARMALLSGADLVLELPVLFAAGSAGDFAAGAVSLLDKLHVCDFLSFGSEAGDLTGISQIARILADEPPVFSEILKKELKGGSSFTKARALALDAALHAGNNAHAHSPVWPQERFAELLARPNNLLGIEYCTALCKRKSAIQPVTVRRRGADYHEEALGQALPSALAIRKALATNGSKATAQLTAANVPDVPEQLPAANVPGTTEQLLAANVPAATEQLLAANVPAAALPVWEEILKQNRLLFPADFTKELRYRLLTESAACIDVTGAGAFTRFADVTRELSNKFQNHLLDFSDWEDLCARAKSKELTYSRISRALCHILLGITADSLQFARENDFVPYARVLGFQRNAQPLLSAIKKSSDIPLLSKLADAHKLLTPQAMEMLKQDIAAAHIYESAMSAKCGGPVRNEYRQQILIL